MFFKGRFCLLPELLLLGVGSTKFIQVAKIPTDAQLSHQSYQFSRVLQGFGLEN